MKVLPRWVHERYAKLFGYFWIPCPICQRMFGGHEPSKAELYTGGGTAKLVCKNCTDVVRQRNKEMADQAIARGDMVSVPRGDRTYNTILIFPASQVTFMKKKS